MMFHPHNQTISVVIPVYNGERTIGQCLESVLRQNYENFEVIVVDNNSTDNTKEIVKKLQSQFNNLKYVFESQKSRGAARNAGINNTKGEIIAMTDSDCIVPKNWLYEITKEIREGKELIVMGFEKSTSNNFWAKNIQKTRQEFLNKNKTKYVDGLDTKNFAIKADLIKKIMFNPEFKSIEDFEFFMRIKNIARICFKPEIKVEHFHDSSLIDFVKTNMSRGFWTSRMYKKYKNTPDEKKFKNVSFKNLLKVPFWVILIFFKESPRYAYFKIIQETSWKAGVIAEKLNFSHIFRTK